MGQAFSYALETAESEFVRVQNVALHAAFRTLRDHFGAYAITAEAAATSITLARETLPYAELEQLLHCLALPGRSLKPRGGPPKKKAKRATTPALDNPGC